MRFESRSECLNRHDNAGKSVILLVTLVPVAADLIWHPRRQEAVDQAGGVAVKAGILLEPPAHPHELRDSDDDMAIPHRRKSFQQTMTEIFSSPVGTGRASPLLVPDAPGGARVSASREWNGQVRLAIRAVQKRKSILGVSAARN